MIYTALASYKDKFVRVLDATGDVDQDYLLDRAFLLATQEFGHPSAITLINTSMPSAYEATMAKVTHSMVGGVS